MTIKEKIQKRSKALPPPKYTLEELREMGIERTKRIGKKKDNRPWKYKTVNNRFILTDD